MSYKLVAKLSIAIFGILNIKSFIWILFSVKLKRLIFSLKVSRQVHHGYKTGNKNIARQFKTTFSSQWLPLELAYRSCKNNYCAASRKSLTVFLFWFMSKLAFTSPSIIAGMKTCGKWK